MKKYLAVLTVSLVILCHPEGTLCQSNITRAAPRADALVGNASSASNKTENKTKSQDVSIQASAEAKRLYREGVKYGRSGLFRQASELFQKAVLLNPNYADAHYGLGLALFDQGRWQEASQSFEQALKLNSKDKEAAAKLEESHVRAGVKTKPAPPKEKRASTVPLSINVATVSRPANDTAAGVPVSLKASTDSRPANEPTAGIPVSLKPSTDSRPANEPTAGIPVSLKPSADSRPANEPTAGIPVSLKVSTDSPPNNSRSASTPRNDLTRIYHIGVGDILDVRFGDEMATQSTLFTVTPTGLLEHPILPTPLQVSGLTVEETSALLEADLKRRAVNENPRVLVGVREYLSHAIIVSGLVKEPGTKLLRREAIPLYVVIADAQPAPEAGRATLIRHETGDAVVVDLSKPAEMNLLVRSGDVITVHANAKQFFYVGGEVKAPGELQFRKGLTLTQAILAAGGLSRESKEAYVAREGDNGLLATTRYKLKDINTGKVKDPLIQPGDRITVEH